MKKTLFISVFLLIFVGLSHAQSIKVTHVKVIVRPTKFSGKCPHKFTFYGRITAVGSGTVKYRWIRSDGARTQAKNLFFSISKTRTVTTTWTIGSAGKRYKNYWQAIKIISPVNKTSNKANFSLECTASAGSLLPGSGIARRNNQSIHRPSASANHPEFGIKSVTVNHRNGGPITGIINYGNRGKPLPVDIKLGLTWNKCFPTGNISCKNSLYIKFGGKNIPFPNNIVPMNPTKFRNGVYNKKFQVSLPGGFRPGTTQTLRCELRPSANGCDGNPANNTILKSFTIGDADCMSLQMGLIKPGPDLKALRVLGPIVTRKRPGTLGLKYRITYKVFIQYIPSEKMPNCHLKDVAFRIAIYLKEENRVIRRRVGIAKDFAPGGYKEEFTQQVNDDLKNKHIYIVLEVDPWKKITEEDETNNTYKSGEKYVKE